jgi:hypothetical protein
VEEEKALTVIVQAPDKHWMCSLWTPVPGHDGILEGISSWRIKKGERRVENTTPPRNYNVVTINLLIDKARAKYKTYMWVSVRWKTKN